MRLRYSKKKMAKLFANSEDTDQMPHFAASDLGLHCLSITLSRVDRLQWNYIKPQNRMHGCVSWSSLTLSAKTMTPILW